MILVAVAWIYVVLMMALAEALSTQGSVLGAVITFVLYGVLPLATLLYIMATPARRRARRARERQASCAVQSGVDPDGSSHAASDAVPTERKEP